MSKVQRLGVYILPLALLLGVISCYEIEPFVPDPNLVYIKGEELPVKTEKDLVAAPTQRIEFGAVVALHLEHFNTDSMGSYPDTDTIGTDRILYIAKDTVLLTFRPEETPTFYVRLIDNASGTEIFDALQHSSPFTVKLAPGKYDMIVGSMIPTGVDTMGFQWVFIQPDHEQLPDTGGVKSLAYKTVYWYLTAAAGRCYRCELSNINLSGVDMVGVDLELSSMRNSKLDGINMQNSRLKGVNFSGSVISKSNLSGVDLSQANLSNADIRYTNFEFSLLLGTNFTDSKANGANFCNTSRNGWLTTGMVTDTSTKCFP